MNFAKESLKLHEELGGKIEVVPKKEVKDKRDLSLVYTPGVAEVCKKIAEDKISAKRLTIKKDTIAIVSDGSAILGLGNLGPEAALPVMEGKAVLFKEFGGINAVPLCIATQDTEEIINFVKNIAPTFGGINLEDISAPRCFEIERRLKEDLNIPVFHDDQHGTAIVVLAALINSLKLAGKKLSDVKVVINGAGAAGTAIANLLNCVDCSKDECEKVKDIIVCDSKGIISKNRKDLKDNIYKKELAEITNKENVEGTLKDAIKGVDIFIGVSKGNMLTKEMVNSMNENPIIFAMANPLPEINPQEALDAGAFIVGTGRSDYPNQINNVLAFPGIFKGTMEAGARNITNSMKIQASHAIANSVENLSRENILPSPLSKQTHKNVAEAVRKMAEKEN
ncbi:NAD-dependent malic enzyme [Candidatus Pacearchaeota archaeon CG10_big_fil_rev_8_21_14_0_10_34_12]|nr:MAG: NAD-dependent malic enzyme [Candidatus Pacearchaeota archaeon CG10_big_fil_rev_8_21_14_0_10_34_12]